MLQYTEENIRKMLIEVASQKTTVSYGQLNAQAPLHLDMKMPNDKSYLGHLLEVVSQYENERQRPLLGALVINAKGTHKGKCDNTFFEHAEKLGRYDGQTDKAEWLKLEQARLFAEWKTGQVRD